MVDRAILYSEADTARLARILVGALRFGDMVGLQGDLGAGKTTLVRRIVAELNGLESLVASPSFALQHEYPVFLDPGHLEYGHIDSGSDTKKVEHWDLYRLREAPEDLYEPPDADTLRLIEWPERSPALIGQLHLLVNITVGEAGKRIVEFSGRRGKEISDLVSSRLNPLSRDS